MVAVPASLERFTFFVLGLSDRDVPAISFFRVVFKRFVNV